MRREATSLGIKMLDLKIKGRRGYGTSKRKCKDCLKVDKKRSSGRRQIKDYGSTI